MISLNKITSNKKLLLAIGIIVLILLVLFVLEKSHVTDLYTKDKPASVTDNPKTTSTAPSAQEDFTGGDERLIPENKKDEGTIQDTGGNVTSTPDRSLWSSSKDSLITVYSPSQNSVVVSGNSLSGESKLAKVNFRLIDDVSGVISMGSLTVINGKFSGTFNFSTSGTNGRLDIFNATADGVESSVVEIPVRFK